MTSTQTSEIQKERDSKVAALTQAVEENYALPYHGCRVLEKRVAEGIIADLIEKGFIIERLNK